MPEEIVENKPVINNTIEGLTLPASAPVTEESLAEAQERLDRRRAILGDEVFEKEQAKLEENKQIVAEGGFVEDNVSGANLQDMMTRFEHGEKVKAEVAVAQDEIEAKEAEVALTTADQTSDSTQTDSSTNPTGDVVVNTVNPQVIPADLTKPEVVVDQTEAKQADNLTQTAAPSVSDSQTTTESSLKVDATETPKTETKQKSTKPTA